MEGGGGAILAPDRRGSTGRVVPPLVGGRPGGGHPECLNGRAIERQAIKQLSKVRFRAATTHRRGSRREPSRQGGGAANSAEEEQQSSLVTPREPGGRQGPAEADPPPGENWDGGVARSPCPPQGRGGRAESATYLVFPPLLNIIGGWRPEGLRGVPGRRARKRRGQSLSCKGSQSGFGDLGDRHFGPSHPVVCERSESLRRGNDGVEEGPKR